MADGHYLENIGFGRGLSDFCEEDAKSDGRM